MSQKERVIHEDKARRMNEAHFPKRERRPLGFSLFMRDISPQPKFGKKDTILMPSARFGQWVGV
ncbi:MAG: hypothetical protein JRI80_00155 [Deltaproteobacteria bacterium]|nr:hypothetical protein [Deltaproteobacteria bacterium]